MRCKGPVAVTKMSHSSVATACPSAAALDSTGELRMLIVTQCFSDLSALPGAHLMWQSSYNGLLTMWLLLLFLIFRVFLESAREWGRDRDGGGS